MEHLRSAKKSFCPECARRGYAEVPSLKDHPLCADCHDVAEVDTAERSEWLSLSDINE